MCLQSFFFFISLTNDATVRKLGFKPHADFKKNDIIERRNLIKAICEQIWSLEYFTDQI